MTPVPLGFEGQPPPRDAARPRGAHAITAATKDNHVRRILMPSLVIIAVFVLIAVLFPDQVEDAVDGLQTNVIGNFGWYYVILVAGSVIFALWMGLGRYGKLKLGGDDDEPEFSRGAWFSMLFAAGMGVGLVFWGTAEPLAHFDEPKPGVAGAPSDIAKEGLAQSFLHWGIHAWAVYAVVGLGLAYAIHRKGRPVSIRWALEPALGSKVHGRVGDIIDITAIIGGTFGVATSLGLGVLQMGAGADINDFATNTTTLQVVMVGILTIIAAFSLVSGLSRALKWLSNANTAMAAALLLFVLIAGPTIFLLKTFVESLGTWMSNLPELTFDVSAFTGAEGEAWQSQWSTFFWGSWISWAPLVGIFIARISRGRTVREFVTVVLLVPALVSFFWFAIFGGVGVHTELFGDGRLIGPDGVDSAAVLFGVLQDLPWTTLVSMVTIVLIATFLITSVNSGGFVLAMLSHGGDPEPPAWSRVLWAVAGGAAAAALLVSGGLVTLQTATIVMAVPFSIVMIIIAIATFKAFFAEAEALEAAEKRAARKEMSDAITAQVSAALKQRARLPDVTAPKVPKPVRHPVRTITRRR